MTYQDLLRKKGDTNFEALVLEFCSNTAAHAHTESEWRDLWNHTGNDSEAEKAVQAKMDELEAPVVNEEEAPTNEEEAPANEEEAPANEEEAPANEEEAPANEEEAPANEEEAPKD